MGYPGGWSESEPYRQYPGSPNQVVFSEKSRVTAGVLQLIGVLGFVGFGRLYLGHIGIAIAQFIGALFAGGALAATLGDWAVPMGPAIVGIIDGALILTGRVLDGHGRALKD